MALDPDALQRQASDPDASVWVSASAGAGKTKVLSDRVLRLLLDGTAPGKLLCLTFTKAAAAEMAIRVNRRLGEWAVVDDRALAAGLADLTGAPVDAALCARARTLFAQVLDTPGGMKIQTIHAFCQSLLGRFPLEAGVAPHFEVMDERTAAELMAAVREEVIAQAREGDDPALAAALATVTAHVGEIGFDEVIGALIGDRRRLGRLIDGAGGIEGAAAAIADHLAVETDDDPLEVVARAGAPDAFDGPGLRAAVAVLETGKVEDRRRAARLAAWLAAPERRVQLYGDYVAALLNDAGTPRKRLMTRDLAQAHPAAAAALTCEAARLVRVESHRRAATIAQASAALLRLGAAMLAGYRAKKAARARLDYDDLVLLSLGLLRQERDVAGWVLFKLDEGIDHILIDEAQDTNPEQWEVVRILTEEFFAGAGRVETGARTVFAVGDAKQSIYSFQRADPRKFDQMRAYFAEKMRAAGLGWRDVPLDISFRSTDAVLAAVDAVFAGPAAGVGVVPEGGHIRHHAFRRGHGGKVVLWPAVAAAPAPAEPPWTPPVQVTPSMPSRRRLAAVIAARLRRWLDDGVRLESRARPITPGDVMVLVRKRGPFVDELVKALKARDIPVAGVDRMELKHQLAVMDLLALARVVLLPEDDLSLAELLKSPLVGLTEDQLFTLAHGRRGSLWAALAARRDDDRAFDRAWQAIRGWREAADFGRPFGFFAHVLTQGGRAALLARLGPEAGDPLDEFLDLALGYERDHVPSLQGFVHWFESGSAEIKRDLEQGVRNQVRILTVHGAKGLQAPIVFLPDMMARPRNDVRLLWAGDEAVFWVPRARLDVPATAALRRDWAEAQRREYHRLLYVAMTRAEDRLYLCGWDGRGRRPEGCWYDLVRDGLAEVARAEEMDFTADSPLGWQGTGWVLETPQRVAPRDDQQTAPLRARAPLPEILRAPPAPEPVPPRPLTPSRPDTPEPAVASPLGRDDGTDFARGLIIHKLLQLLPELPAAARRSAGARFLAAPIHGLAADDRSAILSEVLAVIDHPEFAPLFGPDSQAEVAISALLGDRALSGQIDRLVLRAGEVWVVDYKTNRPPARRPAEVPLAYRRQMAVYRAALLRVYPGRRVRCFLLWTNNARLMALPDALLDGTVA